MNNAEAANKAQTWISHNKPDEGFEFTGEWYSSGGTSFAKFKKVASDGKKRNFYFIYDKIAPALGKCEYDNKQGPITVHCPCGKASYCSQNHMDMDERYHQNNCSY